MSLALDNLNSVALWQFRKIMRYPVPRPASQANTCEQSFGLFASQTRDNIQEMFRDPPPGRNACSGCTCVLKRALFRSKGQECVTSGPSRNRSRRIRAALNGDRCCVTAPSGFVNSGQGAAICARNRSEWWRGCIWSTRSCHPYPRATLNNDR